MLTYASNIALTRYTLLALRHGNVKNQAEIITTVRSSSLLARDLTKMSLASELLRFEDSTPVKAPFSYSRVSACACIHRHTNRPTYACT